MISRGGKVVSIGTHNGFMHLDEVGACATLDLWYPEVEIIRTRDKSILSSLDMRVDVGRKYDPVTGDFDHHQKDPSLVRENGVPYASFGLVWKEFGPRVCGEDDIEDSEIADIIDKRLVQPIDAVDTAYVPKPELNYSIHDVFKVFYSTSERSEDQDLAFFSAVDFMQRIIKKEINVTRQYKLDEEYVHSKHDETKPYIILDKFLMWKNAVEELPNVLYVVYPDKTPGTYSIGCARDDFGTFENRKDFPIAWGGLDDEELVAVTGVEDAKYCHKDLFQAGAYSLEGAIELMKKALDN